MTPEWWNRIAAVLETWEKAADAGDAARDARHAALNDVGRTLTAFAKTYPHAHKGTPESIYEMLEGYGRSHNDTETARRYAKMVGIATGAEPNAPTRSTP